MTKSAWDRRDVVSVLDFSRAELEQLFGAAKEISDRPDSAKKSLDGKILSTAFFEPSTRTRLSFSTAALKLGAKVIDLSPEASSVMKGESLPDTVRMLDGYSDMIVIRHPSEGAALLASEISDAPIINGGDGSQHHPTQAMLDLFTVLRIHGAIDGLVYAMFGDLRYARTVASLLYGLTKFKPKKIYLVSPEALRIRNETRAQVERLGLNLTTSESLEEVLGEVDVLYLTRIQKERFPDLVEFEKVKGSYRVSKAALAGAKKGSIILHPLPRTGELPSEVDSLPSAAYMRQAAWGVPLRMALLDLILGGSR